MTYQASSGIFPMCVILIAFLEWNQRKEGWLSFLLCSAASYLAALALFVLVLMKPTSNGPSAYVSNRLAELSAIPENYINFAREVRSDFRSIWTVLVALLVILFVISAAYRSRQNKALALLTALCCAVLLFLLCFGLYPMLEKTVTNARSMYGIGVCIALIAVGASGTDRSGISARAFSCVLAWMFIAFAATYANGLTAQDEYVNFRITEVIDDLTDLESFRTDTDKTIQVTGSVGYAPAVEKIVGRYGMLKKLIPITFSDYNTNGQWLWGVFKFYFDYGLEQACSYDFGTVDFDYVNWSIVHENIYHTIYEKNGNYVIELKS